MSRRRRNDGALVVIYWRDIPAQVTAGSRPNGHKALLATRFQHAIDRAAAAAGLTDATSYVAQWRRAAEPLVGDPASATETRVADLETSYDRKRLETLVQNGGLEPPTSPSPSPSPSPERGNQP